MLASSGLLTADEISSPMPNATKRHNSDTPAEPAQVGRVVDPAQPSPDHLSNRKRAKAPRDIKGR